MAPKKSKSKRSKRTQPVERQAPSPAPARIELGREFVRNAASGRASLGRVALLLLVVNFLVHGVVLYNGFTLDDFPAIVMNPVINGQRPVLEVFSGSAWAGPLGSGNYRPLTSLTYALQYALSRQPGTFHLVDLLLNVAVALLVYRFVLMLGAGARVGLAAALLFLIHPVHTEVVASVMGRMELMACLFGLLALTAFLTEDKPVASAVLLLAAALSKESGASFWGLMVFAAWLAYPPRAALLRLIPGLSMVAAFVALRAWALGALGVPTIEFESNLVADASYGTRLLTALHVQAEYLRLLVWPVNLSYDYSYHQIPAVESVTLPVLVGLATFFAPLVAGLMLLRRREPMGLVLLVYPTTLFLASNLILPIGTIMGERLLFTPSITFCILLALGLSWIAGRLERFPGWPVIAYLPLLAVLAAYGARSHLRDRDWRDGYRLHVSSLEAAPASARLNLAVAIELRQKRRFEEALSYLERAERILPDSLDVHLQRGLIHMDLDEPDAAERSFLRAYEIRPEHFVAPRMLAELYRKRQQADRAAVWQERAKRSTAGMERR